MFWLSLGLTFLGFIGVLYCLYFWLYDEKNNDSDLFKSILATLISPIFFFGGIFFLISYLNQINSFRQINISDVSEFRIIESKSALEPDGKRQIIFSDQSVIQTFLQSLQNCKEFSPNHETFENGYNINLIFQNNKYGKDYYISVYKNSTAKNGRNTVTPHFGIESNLNLGNYDCPEFQNLTKTHIDPLFQKSKNKFK